MAVEIELGIPQLNEKRVCQIPSVSLICPALATARKTGIPFFFLDNFIVKCTLNNVHKMHIYISFNCYKVKPNGQHLNVPCESFSNTV